MTSGYIVSKPDYQSVTGTDGNPIATYSIEDMPGLNEVRYANYTADEFIVPHNQISGEIVDLEKQFSFEGKGTLQFVFMGLNPYDEEFNSKSEALAPYLKGDNSWHFTFYLPAITGAVNVYVLTQYVYSSGEISNYSFIKYSDYNNYTENHVTASESFFIDLSFYSQRHALSDDLTIRAKTITIHFEAEEGKTATLTSMPVVGKEEDVVSAVNSDRTALIVMAGAAALVFVLFLLITIIKQAPRYLPPILTATGIFGYAFFNQIFYGICSIPYAALVLAYLSAALVPLSAIFYLRVNTGKFPLWLAFAAFGAASCVISALTPVFGGVFIPINIVCSTITALCVVVLSLLSLFRDEDNPTAAIIPIISATYIVCFTYDLRRAFFFITPHEWICALLLLTITVTFILLFAQTERRNAALTANLKDEVKRQTMELRSIIDDRDELLRYLSHDLKKPAVYAKQTLTALKKMETKDEKLKLICDAERKIQNIDDNLAYLQYISKYNYTSESESVTEINEVLETICETLKPDCDAQGVILKLHSKKMRALAKHNLLVSVLSNLIFNALEHAECSFIELKAESIQGMCIISVTDDGKGLEDEEKAFMPYYTEADNGENNGLGLYLCKKHMQSMGGDLTYERCEEKTVFKACLPLHSGLKKRT